mmetsp:Transcript_34976/g.47788  ORF Transcript_34976/g.47788 Transcript_34976/m.47788 type:complete len:184 (+) Transcript_34976:226-777(+)
MGCFSSKGTSGTSVNSLLSKEQEQASPLFKALQEVLRSFAETIPPSLQLENNSVFLLADDSSLLAYLGAEGQWMDEDWRRQFVTFHSDASNFAQTINSSDVTVLQTGGPSQLLTSYVIDKRYFLGFIAFKTASESQSHESQTIMGPIVPMDSIHASAEEASTKIFKLLEEGVEEEASEASKGM